jgi:hypothetical protein
MFSGGESATWVVEPDYSLLQSSLTTRQHNTFPAANNIFFDVVGLAASR